MDYKMHFAESLSNIFTDELTQKQILELIESPKQDEFGDAAFPCFSLAKQYKKAPAIIAKEVAQKLSDPFFTKVEAVGPYVNVFFNRETVSDTVLKTILAEKEEYGHNHFGCEKTVVIEYSSP